MSLQYEPSSEPLHISFLRRAKVAHVRHSRPDSGPDFQVRPFELARAPSPPSSRGCLDFWGVEQLHQQTTSHQHISTSDLHVDRHAAHQHIPATVGKMLYNIFGQVRALGWRASGTDRHKATWKKEFKLPLREAGPIKNFFQLRALARALGWRASGAFSTFLLALFLFLLW